MALALACLVDGGFEALQGQDVIQLAVLMQFNHALRLQLFCHVELGPASWWLMAAAGAVGAVAKIMGS